MSSPDTLGQPQLPLMAMSGSDAMQRQEYVSMSMAYITLEGMGNSVGTASTTWMSKAYAELVQNWPYPSRAAGILESKQVLCLTYVAQWSCL